MLPTEVPVNYMDATDRFVTERGHNHHDPTFADKYATDIYVDCHAAALRAAYTRSAADVNKNKKQYRRAEQLRAGTMSYYPGRDSWLQSWGNERQYGLPQPQMHDDYSHFIQGKRNGDWVRGEKEVEEKTKLESKVRRGGQR
jgi:hypothetical protein